MKNWIRLVIDVDYSPSDPGISNWFCDRTGYDKADVTAGKLLPYKDSGGLFRSIRVVESSDAGVVLEYCGKQYSLTPENPYKKLDEDGRDYTNFYLNVSLDLEYKIENTREFFRQFQTKVQLARLSDKDIKQFEASDDPCAKYVLGRWHYVIAPREDSPDLAYKYTVESADAGIADAMATLAIMLFNGENYEGTADYETAAKLREKAVKCGSELAAMNYARNRIAGILLAPEEPEAVAREIEKLRQEDADFNPEWYSVLAYAYETLGRDDDARRMYEEGIAHGSVRCYGELAVWFQAHGMEEDYDKTMEEGRQAGCGYCFIQHYDLPEEEYQKRTPDLQRHFTRYLTEKLERGLELGESCCAYLLAYNYFYGDLGFDKDSGKTADYLSRGMNMGDAMCYSLYADILEMGNPSDQDKKDAAVLRLKALRLGNDSVQSKVIIAYRRGLLSKYQDEIEQYWLPEDYDDYEEDDSRWDPYV